MCRACGSLRVAATELATVISRPSRTQATPSAMTSRVWKLDHGSRSMRAGMVLRMMPRSSLTGSAAATVMRRWFPVLRTSEHVVKVRHTWRHTVGLRGGVLEPLHPRLLAQALLEMGDVAVVGRV